MAGRMTAVQKEWHYTHPLPNTYAVARLTSFTHVVSFLRQPTVVTEALSFKTG